VRVKSVACPQLIRGDTQHAQWATLVPGCYFCFAGFQPVPLGLQNNISRLAPDRAKIQADGSDLSYVTVTVADKSGLMVPRSKNHIQFSVEGPGEIVATDNGDATSLVSFQSPERDAYNGLALVIVRAKPIASLISGPVRWFS
jgi:Glycoside hydrolase family 2 C-terminal domain 5